MTIFSLKRPSSRSLQWLHAWSSLKRPVISSAQFFSGFIIFHPKTHILIPQHPNSFPKIVYKDMYIKDTPKSYGTWNQNIISTQFINLPIVHKTFNNNLNLTTNSIIMNTHSMNPQQQHLIPTTTPIRHEFINNPTTTTSYFTNCEQNTKYTCIYNLNM